jgi:hypothetical protein
MGPMSRSKLCENGPENSGIKNTVAHSIPEGSPRIKKSSIRPDHYMRGLPVLKF